MIVCSALVPLFHVERTSAITEEFQRRHRRPFHVKRIFRNRYLVKSRGTDNLIQKGRRKQDNRSNDCIGGSSFT